MPTYEVKAPNGKTYDIEADAGATLEQLATAVLAKYPAAAVPAQIRAAPQIEQATRQDYPATAITQPATPTRLQDVNWNSAFTSALVGTTVGMAAAILLHWLITRHLWRRLRTTPHQTGLWCGSWIASLSLGLGVGKLANIAHGFSLSENDWYLYGFHGSVIQPLLYFPFGYCLGWVFRRVKPLAMQVAATPIEPQAPEAPIAGGSHSDGLQTHRHPESTTAVTRAADATDEHFAEALTELEEGRQDKGLWARCYAEANGNESHAKAAYLRGRAAALATRPRATISGIGLQGTPANATAPSETTSNQQDAAAVTLPSLDVLRALKHKVKASSNWRVAHQLTLSLGYLVIISGGGFIKSSTYEVRVKETLTHVVTLSSPEEFVKWVVDTLCND